jgi:hypothetical protein
MSGHTKGPWEIASYRNFFGFSIWSPHGPCIAERWYQHERTADQDAEMEANAHLIAAAPDLLEAAKLAIDSLTHSVPGDCWSNGPNTGDVVEDHIVCPGCRALNSLTKAIAKAEGKR